MIKIITTLVIKAPVPTKNETKTDLLTEFPHNSTIKTVLVRNPNKSFKKTEKPIYFLTGSHMPIGL
jgi:hypothetical protein